jgi:hypothetical protein
MQEQAIMAKVLKGDFTRGKKAQRKKPRSSADEKLPGYQLKLSLPFSDPLIWRRIQVPGQLTLAHLHRVIQICMGWNDSDTHQFLVGKIFYSPGFGIEDFTRKPQYDEASFELHQLEEAMQFIFTYLYDGGEGWELEITLEDILAPDSPASAVLLDGEYGCPPEDVGDIHRFQALLAALDEAGAEAPEISLGFGGTMRFHPSACDKDKINAQLKKLCLQE